MAIIFDMDGVISYTQHIHARLESEVLATFGLIIAPEEISRRFAGVSNRDMFATLFGEVGRASPYSAEISDLIAKRFCECENEIVAIEGTVARIVGLHGRTPMAVASASRPEVIDLVLTSVGVEDRFSAIASSREVKRGKPAPDVFLLAAERLKVEPKDCVVVEDGVSGMIGARAAGMRCIALASDDRIDYPADLVVRDLRDVPEAWFIP